MLFSFDSTNKASSRYDEDCCGKVSKGVLLAGQRICSRVLHFVVKINKLILMINIWQHRRRIL
jgi:hypothetical protein